MNTYKTLSRKERNWHVVRRRKGRTMEYEYFMWLVDSIDPLKTARDYYQPIFEELYLRDFEWGSRFEDDANRASDGLVLREIYAHERGMPVSEIGIDWKPCSCLEMMIGIARRIEFEILAMPGEENIPRWFWRFMEGLGLSVWKVGIDDISDVDRKINIWLDRRYQRNGDGGIFVVRDPYFDMRRMPIWKQMSAVLNEYEETDY